jgi:RNA polymerase sigma-70 factor (ECF subfamily)
LAGETDAELVKATLDGQTNAFEKLYRRHWSGLHRFVGRLIGGRSADLAQETFLTAYLSLRHLRNPVSFQSWLFGIALNVCRQAMREVADETRLVGRLTGGWYQREMIPGPEEQVELEYEVARIRRAVAGLPTALRRAVELRYLESLSVRETSILLGISQSTTKTRLHRARRRLRERLAVQVPEGRKPMKQVEILDVISEGIVLFVDWEGARVFPVFMSKEQVNSIAIGLKAVDVGRPLTFQFISSVIEQLGGKVESVCITSLSEEGTFYAKLTLSNGKEVDARPSDAVNLAIVVGAPLYVDEEVINKVGIEVSIDEEKRRAYKAKGLDALAEELKMLAMAKLQREGLTRYVRMLFSDESEDRGSAADH